MSTNKICFFICTHNKRKVFLDGFIFHYKRAKMPFPLFVFTNEKTRIDSENIHFIIDNLGEMNPTENRSNIWGSRLVNAIDKLQKIGFDKAVFNPDDGWILDENVDLERLNAVIEKFDSMNADSFRLSQKVPSYHGFTFLENDFELIEKKFLSCYLTHQTSIWKLSSLGSVTNNSDSSSQHEWNGSQRCIDNNFRLFQYSKEPILDSIGIHHCEAGYYIDKLEKSIIFGFDPKKNESIQ